MVALSTMSGKRLRDLVAPASLPYLLPFINAGVFMSSDLEPNTEANRLYWETETSVSEISQRLHLSRRALYDALQPVPTGAACVFCGGELVYENRSARASHEAICAQCRARPDAAPDVAPAIDEPEHAVIDPRTVRLGGAMVIGAIFGAAATLIALPRR